MAPTTKRNRAAELPAPHPDPTPGPVTEQGPELQPSEFTLSVPAESLELGAIDVTTYSEPPGSSSIPGLAEPVTRPYTPHRWKNVVDVFRCSTCGHCTENEDDIILHVVGHAQKDERDALLDVLMAAMNRPS